MYTTLTPDELEDRIAIAFLERFVADRAGGRIVPLAQYLGDFAAYEGRIVREWALATGQWPVATAAVGAVGTEPAAAPGHIGSYRLERELGRGAQGVVYLAEDTRFGRPVALKVLDVDILSLAGPALLRFRREADAIARLHHPGVATVYDAAIEGGRAWIAMRYVDGQSLRQWLDARIAAGSGPPRGDDLTTAVRLVAETARALGAAHRAGIVHRDVKPANILRAASGEPVLVDFGLAADEHARTPTITLPGAVFGTLCYLAPERLAGAPADARADLHALGAVLYELLAHRRQHQAATMAAELKQNADAAPIDVRTHNPAVARDLAVVVATAMAHAPDERYATADAFADDLERVLALRPIAARPVPAATRLLRWAQRNRALAASLLALAFVLAAGLAATLWQWGAARGALEDVRRLADLKLANELVARADRLWPVRAETVPAMRSWQQDLADLRTREPAHTRRRDALAGAGDERTVVWEREQLTALFGVLAKLDGLDHAVADRMQRATTLAARSLEHPAWPQASARIAANPHYGGLALAPQLGLVPLGPDPDSGLEEFAHVESGEPAVRGADGRLVLTEATGLVFVLVPGGPCVLGVENAAHADHSAANVDPAAPQGEQPCYAVDLLPYFLSRYEMTQAQWQRHTGTDPATFRPGGGLAPIHTTLHPVELVDWETCDRVLHELDLVLPSEAQWEHAYRAGRATIYPFGDDPHGLVGRENLADVTARDQGVNRRLRFVDWLDDGFLQHAPIGSFRPNAFGFHDMGGNVKEWCNDSWENYADAAPRAGDGLRRGAYDEYRVLRGGSFSSYVDEATCAYRFGAQRVASGAELGLRPARAVER